jgi:membrane-associated protease RseP (regulator of RpoE activity)
MRWGQCLGLAIVTSCIHYTGGEDRKDEAPSRLAPVPIPPPREPTVDPGDPPPSSTPAPSSAEDSQSSAGSAEQPATAVPSQSDRGWLGVGLSMFALTPGASEQGGAPGDGAPVRFVLAGSPAQQAGLKVGDVLTSVNGTPLRDAVEAQQALHALHAGQTATVTYRQGSSEHQITLTAAPMPMETMTSLVSVNGTQPPNVAAEKQLLLQTLSAVRSTCADVDKYAIGNPDDAAARRRADSCRQQVDLAERQLRLALKQLELQDTKPP